MRQERPRSRTYELNANSQQIAGLVAWFPGDMINSTTVWNAVGPNATGTSLVFSNGPGGVPAWRFSTASAGYISCNTNKIPTGGEARSISLWMNESSDSSGTYNALVNFGSSSGQSFLFLMDNIGGTQYMFTDGVNIPNNITLSGTQLPADNTWNHLCLTSTSSNYVYYLNGKKAASGSWGVAINTALEYVEIGRRQGFDYFNGSMCDVRIYNKVLTDSQVAEIFDLQSRWQLCKPKRRYIHGFVSTPNEIDFFGRGFLVPLTETSIQNGLQGQGNLQLASALSSIVEYHGDGYLAPVFNTTSNAIVFSDGKTGFLAEITSNVNFNSAGSIDHLATVASSEREFAAFGSISQSTTTSTPSDFPCVGLADANNIVIGGSTETYGFGTFSVGQSQISSAVNFGLGGFQDSVGHIVGSIVQMDGVGYSYNSPSVFSNTEHNASGFFGLLNETVFSMCITEVGGFVVSSGLDIVSAQSMNGIGVISSATAVFSTFEAIASGSLWPGVVVVSIATPFCGDGILSSIDANNYYDTTEMFGGGYLAVMGVVASLTALPATAVLSAGILSTSTNAEFATQGQTQVVVGVVGAGVGFVGEGKLTTFSTTFTSSILAGVGQFNVGDSSSFTSVLFGGLAQISTGSVIVDVATQAILGAGQLNQISTTSIVGCLTASSVLESGRLSIESSVKFAAIGKLSSSASLYSSSYFAALGNLSVDWATINFQTIVGVSGSINPASILVVASSNFISNGVLLEDGFVLDEDSLVFVLMTSSICRVVAHSSHVVRYLSASTNINKTPSFTSVVRKNFTATTPIRRTLVFTSVRRGVRTANGVLLTTMSAPQEVQLGDYGTIFEMTVVNQDGDAVDLSAATTLQIVFRKPDASTVTKTATLSSDGTDGKMRYVATSSVIDTVGVWQLQGVVVVGGGSWRTEVETFRVLPNVS